MTGKIAFDSYKYRVFHENGITQEQDHLLENINENTLFDFKKPESKDKVVSVKAKRQEDEVGEITNTPFNIDYKTESELLENKKKQSIDDIIGQQLKKDYEELLLSPEVSQEDKETLMDMIRKVINSISKGITGSDLQIIDLQDKTNEIKKKNQMDFEKRLQNQNTLLGVGIVVAILIIIIFYFLVKNKKVRLNLSNVVRNYG
jgi:hypothetical protein